MVDNSLPQSIFGNLARTVAHWSQEKKVDFWPPERRLDYRKQARIIRGRAARIEDATIKGQLLLVASLYDKLAGSADPPAAIAAIREAAVIEPTRSGEELDSAPGISWGR
jgi:hypothetical protein